MFFHKFLNNFLALYIVIPVFCLNSGGFLFPKHFRARLQDRQCPIKILNKALYKFAVSVLCDCFGSVVFNLQERAVDVTFAVAADSEGMPRPENCITSITV